MQWGIDREWFSLILGVDGEEILDNLPYAEYFKRNRVRGHRST
jgi:hypothetical protein